MSWVGGKKALREAVVKRFPLNYSRYIEVFGGGGWVLFHKPPRRDFEVYNDFNGLLANLYRCVRDKPDLLINALEYVLNSREDFDRIRRALDTRRPATDIQSEFRAAAILIILLHLHSTLTEQIPRPAPAVKEAPPHHKKGFPLPMYLSPVLSGKADRIIAQAFAGQQFPFLSLSAKNLRESFQLPPKSPADPSTPLRRLPAGKHLPPLEEAG